MNVTVANVISYIEADASLTTRIRLAAWEAYCDWSSDAVQTPPYGWIGGRVRDQLSPIIDAALGTAEDAGVHGDPTGELGEYFYPDVARRTEAQEAALGALVKYLDKKEGRK